MIRTTHKERVKINKQKRLSELRAQIEQCDAYIKMGNDPSAAVRVQALDKNPCLSGMYYLNAIYKNPQNEFSEEAVRQYSIYNEKHTIPYNTATINGYVLVEGSLWRN